MQRNKEKGKQSISLKTIQINGEYLLKIKRKKICQARIIHLAKIFLKSENDINTFFLT